MKAAGYLFIAFVLLFCAQFLIFGRKVNKSHAAASETLVNRGPREAYDVFKPVFGTSNVKTLGAADKAETKFLDACVREAVLPLERGRLDFPAALRIESTMEILEQIETDWKIDTGGRQTEILKALAEARPALEQGNDLSAWDRTTQTLGRAAKMGWAPESYRATLDATISDFKRVDRRGIGLRDATARAAANLRAGVEALGLLPGAKPEDGLLAPLPATLDGQKLSDADRPFTDAVMICRGFATNFGESAMPIELWELHTKALLNLCAMRTHHLQTDGARMLSAPSDYLVKLYVRPGSTNTPSAGEMYGSFIQAVEGQLGALRSDTDALGPKLGGQGALMRAAAAKVRMAYDAAMRRSSDAPSRYAQARGEAMAATEAQADMQTLAGSATLCVFIQ